MSCMIHVSLFLYVSYMCAMFLPVVVMTREILLEECISVMDIREKVKTNAWKRLLEGGKREERNPAHGHDRLGLSRGRGGQNEP